MNRKSVRTLIALVILASCVSSAESGSHSEAPNPRLGSTLPEHPGVLAGDRLVKDLRRFSDAIVDDLTWRVDIRADRSMEYGQGRAAIANIAGIQDSMTLAVWIEITLVAGLLVASAILIRKLIQNRGRLKGHILNLALRDRTEELTRKMGSAVIERRAELVRRTDHSLSESLRILYSQIGRLQRLTTELAATASAQRRLLRSAEQTRWQEANRASVPLHRTFRPEEAPDDGT